MRSVLFLAIFGGVLMQQAAFSQNADPLEGHETRCFFASKSFSQGAAIRVGASIHVCMLNDGAPLWQKDEIQSSVNCLFRGEFYAPGALEEATSTKQTIVCKEDGKWVSASGIEN